MFKFCFCCKKIIFNCCGGSYIASPLTPNMKRKYYHVVCYNNLYDCKSSNNII